MGGLSDLYPLGGWHRRSYFALAAVVQAAGYAGLMTLHAYHYAALACLLIVAGTGAAMAGVLINAAMVSVGNRTGRFGVLAGALPDDAAAPQPRLHGETRTAR